MKRWGGVLLVGGSVAGLSFGGTWAVNREIRNRDAGFNQMMWELWENPDRDRNVSPEQNPRIQECQRYLAGGFWHTVVNEPPFGALERFEGVSREEYDKHCLAIAKSRFTGLLKEMKEDLEKKQ